MKFEAVFLLNVWVFLVVDFFEKHIVGSAPEATVAVECAVGDHHFAGFGVVDNIFKDIKVTLEVAVDTVKFEAVVWGFWFGHESSFTQVGG